MIMMLLLLLQDDEPDTAMDDLLNDPETTCQSTEGTLTAMGRELHSDEPNYLFVFGAAFCMIVSMFILVTLLAVCIHFSYWIQDHWCCCCCRILRTSNPGTTTVAARARLQGLQGQEQARIVEYMFRDDTLQYQILLDDSNDETSTLAEQEEENKGSVKAESDAKEDHNTHSHKNDKPTVEENATKEVIEASSNSENAKPAKSMEVTRDADDKDARQTNRPASRQDDATQQTCGMCDTPFQAGDALWAGKPCGHVFHRACGREWIVKKSHYHCPACRVDLFSAVAYRHAALDVLGPVRVALLGNTTTTTGKTQEPDEVDAARTFRAMEEYEQDWK